MRFRSITTKSIAAGLALAVSVPAVALAANPFEDVPEGQWYTEAVDWAYNLGLTTGKTPTTFNGWDNTNRYEMVTMFQRFNEAVIDPILADIDALEADVDALEVPDDLAAAFDVDARRFFDDAAPSYRRNVLRWLAKAKTGATRTKRIHSIVDESRAGRRLPQM